MVVVAVILVAVLTFVIAAWAIGREARRLGTQRLMPVYRLEEAVDEVAASLPFDVAAAVSRADLTMVLREHINLVQFAEGAAADVDAANPLLLEGESVVAAVYRRTRADGLDLTRPQVDAMVAGHIGYLAAIGAITTVE